MKNNLDFFDKKIIKNYRSSLEKKIDYKVKISFRIINN